MQYGQPYDSVYTEVIKPVCEDLGLAALRADDVQKPGIILQDIVRSILESDVIIAEITPPNPNVFYELGYAHALSKNTILLAERGKELPFDIRSYRCIFYDNTIRGKREVEAALRKHLGSIFREK
jgi:nucleoside 2-deoxyribosyltransferase